MKGRRPKPTMLRLLEGNPGKRKINRNEPQTTAPLEIPDIVAANPAAAAEWRRVVASMPPGFSGACDSATLTAHCMAWALLMQAWDQVQRDGMTSRGSMGQPTAHPALAVIAKQSATLLQCADRLGLHPVARARLEMPHPIPPRLTALPDDDDPDDPEGLLRG